MIQASRDGSSWCKDTWSKVDRDALITTILQKLPVEEVVVPMKSGEVKKLDLRSKLMGMLEANTSVSMKYWLTPEQMLESLRVLNIKNVYIWQWDETAERYLHLYPHLIAREYRYISF